MKEEAVGSAHQGRERATNEKAGRRGSAPLRRRRLEAAVNFKNVAAVRCQFQSFSNVEINRFRQLPPDIYCVTS